VGITQVIVLDTHIWVWWVGDEQRLSKLQVEAIRANETGIIGISAISCWEIAKLVERKRLQLSRSLREWFEDALGYPGIRLFALTPEVAIESASLPAGFHQDPADQIIVATARLHGCSLVTSDGKILAYSHVTTIK
jgi:PIN domain nuclease of toxin-antitoxin system